MMKYVSINYGKYGLIFYKVFSLPTSDGCAITIRDEFDLMTTNQVWKLVDLPYGRMPHWEQVGTQGKKCRASGSTDKCKVCLAVKGYT